MNLKKYLLLVGMVAIFLISLVAFVYGGYIFCNAVQRIGSIYSAESQINTIIVIAEEFFGGVLMCAFGWVTLLWSGRKSVELMFE